MKNETNFQVPPDNKVTDMLQEFVNIFRSMGWLDQTILIRRHEKKYRISCSETGFMAYRVNDFCHISPGIPGWPVCFVSNNHIINDADMSRWGSAEPSAFEWLRCISSGDLEII